MSTVVAVHEQPVLRLVLRVDEPVLADGHLVALSLTDDQRRAGHHARQGWSESACMHACCVLSEKCDRAGGLYGGKAGKGEELASGRMSDAYRVAARVPCECSRSRSPAPCWRPLPRRSPPAICGSTSSTSRAAARRYSSPRPARRCSSTPGTATARRRVTPAASWKPSATQALHRSITWSSPTTTATMSEVLRNSPRGFRSSTSSTMDRRSNHRTPRRSFSSTTASWPLPRVIPLRSPAIRFRFQVSTSAWWRRPAR